MGTKQAVDINEQIHIFNRKLKSCNNVAKCNQQDKNEFRKQNENS